MTNEQASELLLMLKYAYPSGDVNADPDAANARQALYLSAFTSGKWRYETMRQAISEVVMQCRFYPTLAEIKASYDAANRPRPELAKQSNALPAMGDTTASKAEVDAAMAKVNAILGIDLGKQIDREAAK